MDNARRVVVIGSGPAGAMAAHELVRQSVPVTLLEAGQEMPSGLLLRIGGHNILRRSPLLPVGKDHVVSGDPRTGWFQWLAPGGLSNHWTGAVPRFAPLDFTEGERLHERYRWPLSYEDLASYYERVERLMRVTGDTRDVPNLPAGVVTYRRQLPDGWRKIDTLAQARGQGLTTMPLADGSPMLLARQGTAFNSFTHLIRPLLRSPHFELLTGAHALRLEWSNAKRRVDGVVYHDHASGEQRRVAADAVVVACGALHSTKLLFDSSCPDFPDGLGNTDGVLGKFLHDHPREWWALDMEHPLPLLAPAAYLTRLPYESSPPLLATSWTLGTVGIRDRIVSRFGAKSRTIGVQVIGTMVPSAQHYAQPADRKKDAFGLPALDLCIRFSPGEIDNIHHARQRMLELLADAGHSGSIREIDPQLVPGTSAHYGGTARMHKERRYGVVDSWNRIFDTPNVIVCDAGCFTTASEKNPTLTVMAIAARAAERLADDLKKT